MQKLIILLLLPLYTFSQTLYVEAEALIETKQYVKAEQKLAPFVSKNSSDLRAIELLGDVYGYQKKWDNAIVEYKKLTEAAPNIGNNHYKYGGALGMKALSISKLKAVSIIGDCKAAFLKAAALDAKHIDARWALVELYMQLPGIIGGSKAKSFKYANELQALSTVDGYLAKGYIYEYDDEPELAEKFYKLAIDEGGSVTCYSKLAKLYESEGQSTDAITTIEAAHKKHNRNAMHYQIGKVCADYNVQLEKGTACLKTYINNYTAKDGVPKAWAYYRLAQISKHKENRTEAHNWIDKAIADLPKLTVFKTFKNKI